MNSFFKKSIICLLLYMPLLHSMNQGHYTNRIKKLIHIIETRGPQKTKKYQSKVLNELRENNNTVPPKKSYPHIIDLFSHGKEYPIVTNNQTVLEYTIHHFWEIPGYQKTLHTFMRNLNNPNNAKGSMYELQRAAALHKAYPDYTIIAFNTHRHLPSTASKYPVSKEFDLIMQSKENKRKEYWFEFKDRNFDNISTTNETKRTSLCAQFLLQQRIVDMHNDLYDKDITFQVSSKQPLKEKWQMWFEEKEIEYTEGVEEPEICSVSSEEQCIENIH